MPFNTRNPIPSGDLRDLDDNARNIDTWANDKTKVSHPDRFGVERRTWHGIEQEANLNIQQAIDAKNAAQEAAMMSGFSKYADTLAQLESGIGTEYTEGDVVMVFQDESRGDTSSIFKIESGAAEFKLTFDKTRQDLLSFTGNITADAQWSDVPAHSDPAFDVQAQALANQAELLNKRTEGILNVRAFINTPIDGVTSNQDGIEDAVAAALAAGASLEWPGGAEYVSTRNIPNFWGVRHTGKGVIRRGGAVLKITPKSVDTTTLFVGPTGSNANDGLSQEFPCATIMHLMRAISDNHQFCDSGEVKIKLLAGNYTGSLFAETTNGKIPVTTRPILIEGTYSGEWPALSHQTHVVGSGSRVDYGITSTSGNGRSVRIHGVFWENFYSAHQLWNGFSVETRYCRYKNIEIPEFHQGRCNVDSRYNIFDDVGTTHYVQYSSRGAIYYNKFNNIERGPNITRSSNSHVDFNEFTVARIAMVASLNGRISSEGNVFRSVDIAHAMQSGGIVAADPSNDYGTIGTDTKRVFCIDGDAQELRWNGYDGARDHARAVWAKLQNIGASADQYLESARSGSPSTTLVSVPAGVFNRHINKIVVNVFGSARVTSEGSVNIKFHFGDSVFSYPLKVTGSSGRPFKASIELFGGENATLVDGHLRSFETTSPYHFVTITQDGFAPSCWMQEWTGGGGFNSGFNVKVQISTGSGDSVVVRRVEAYVR